MPEIPRNWLLTIVPAVLTAASAARLFALQIPARVSVASLLGVLLLAGTGYKTLYSHVNRPLPGNQVWPDWRATAEIQQPRGQEDVLVILCLSGGGSRAAWFSAATMLRLENVVDEVNLLHEVDVISAVSGGCLPAAYYCLTRDPGPYSVVHVETLPERLPPELEKNVKMDRRHGLLGVREKMSAEQRDCLLPLFVDSQDRARVEQLFWLSQHTRAPAIWEPEGVRDLMTRDYIQWLFWDSFAPMNILRFWFTCYDRSDIMAKIFNRYLFGAPLVKVPKPLQEAAGLEFLGWLDRTNHLAAGPSDEDDLRWPRMKPYQSSLRLDWIPGYSQASQGAQFVAGDVMKGGVQRITRNFRRVLPYRFKDLNPERPYLILNATDGTEDDHDELHYGEVFPFTREAFKRQLDSNIDDYPVAWGVMGSAAFPGVFNYVTLRDFRPKRENSRPRYLHVFDGGNSDNLGLTSAKQIILANRNRYRHFVVLLVDSHISQHGASRYNPDVRSHLVDMNFISSFDTLLDNMRRHRVAQFESGVLDGQDLSSKLTFWQIKIDDVRDAELRTKANQIPTTFKIEPESVKVIEQCVNDLVRPDHPKLQEILRALHVSPKTLQPEKATTVPMPTPDVQALVPAAS